MFLVTHRLLQSVSATAVTIFQIIQNSVDGITHDVHLT